MHKTYQLFAISLQINLFNPFYSFDIYIYMYQKYYNYCSTYKLLITSIERFYRLEWFEPIDCH